MVGIGAATPDGKEEREAGVVWPRPERGEDAQPEDGGLRDAQARKGPPAACARRPALAVGDHAGRAAVTG